MQQPVYNSMADVIAAVVQAHAGVTQYGSLNLVYNTAAIIENDRKTFVDAQFAVEGARDDLRDCRIAVNQKRAAALEFITLARDNFKPILGRKPSVAWGQAGYDGSLALPRSLNDVVYVAQKTAQYLEQNTAMEVESKGITAAQATIVYNQLTAAIGALNTQEGQVASLTRDRDLALAALRKRIRNLFTELSKILSPMDSRWLAFGFNIPGLVATPPAPSSLSGLLIGAGSAALKWEPSARVEYYRVWKRVVGVDEELVAIGNTSDLDFLIEGLPANSTVEFAVSAVNSGGESAKTAVFVLQTA